VRDYTRTTGMAHTILRPSAVYGPLDMEDRVVSRFLSQARRGGVLQVNGANEALDFTYVDDVAQGIAAATVSANTQNTTYNISRGSARTLKEAAELAVAVAGQGTIEINAPDENFPRRGTLNNTQANLDFGYQPHWNIEQGFKIYYDWLAQL